MHQHVQDQPIRIDQDMALGAALIFFRRRSRAPRFCVVFAD